ncbi:hypothetical protein AVEN_103006-1 [Araneus ventricosus]|uniref:Uncharacterized protein n=1 Tax=Araneus ventricosus TaxID=182803 RepID=A0A4Y2B7H2_ARAVE|nr:hypothetical protein AVEN_103006-1 [Araneus ventricosus]
MESSLSLQKFLEHDAKVGLSIVKPAGVVSPKFSRILLEKGAVSPPPAWIKKFEPIVTQDPMTIRNQIRRDAFRLNEYRLLLFLGSRTILPRAQIATSTHAHGESDEKKAPSRSQ